MFVTGIDDLLDKSERRKVQGHRYSVLQYCIITTTHKKKRRYQGVYKEFACGMGFGNFTANYYIKLSLFGLKLMPLPIITSGQ